MTTLFRASNWASELKDSIVSRGVTTCVGMTAHTVVLAQTRLGFLTGGRKKSFLDLLQDEQTVQLEKAYADTTVAITRAGSLCLIMAPLDMKGFIGAATVMDTLMYGAGHLHDHDLCHFPPDDFFRMLHSYWPAPHAIAVECHQGRQSDPRMRDWQLCTHPPFGVVGGWIEELNGQGTRPATYPHNTCLQSNR